MGYRTCSTTVADRQMLVMRVSYQFVVLISRVGFRIDLFVVIASRCWLVMVIVALLLLMLEDGCVYMLNCCM